MDDLPGLLLQICPDKSAGVPNSPSPAGVVLASPASTRYVACFSDPAAFSGGSIYKFAERNPQCVCLMAQEMSPHTYTCAADLLIY